MYIPHFILPYRVTSLYKIDTAKNHYIHCDFNNNYQAKLKFNAVMSHSNINNNMIDKAAVPCTVHF